MKNWGQGARQREMEIAGNSSGCRKKREELINRDRDLDRKGWRKATIVAGYRAERGTTYKMGTGSCSKQDGEGRYR